MTSAPPTTQRPAILIVEDDPDVLRVLRRLIQATYQQHDVQTACNGVEALEKLARLPSLALVMTDYNMPEMNGLDLATNLKVRAPKLPVVLITAFATAELERKARDAGVDFFLPKPFQLEQVEQVIERALS